MSQGTGKYGFEGLLQLSASEVISADVPLEEIEESCLANVKQRLAATLGTGVAQWFTIVSSTRLTADTQLVGLLLEKHLPILVPVDEEETGEAFLIGKYDGLGRRALDEEQRDWPVQEHKSLAEALVAAEAGYRELCAQRDAMSRVGEAGELPEERWLYEQFGLAGR